VAEKEVDCEGLHSAEAHGLQVMVGGRGLMAAVSEHEAWLPAWSVATQVACTPLQSQLVAMDTVPSAFSVQHAVELAGHEHLTVGGVQQSVAAADTLTAGSPQLAEAAEMAQVMDGGVVSTTVNELEQVALRPVEAEVAV